MPLLAEKPHTLMDGVTVLLFAILANLTAQVVYSMVAAGLALFTGNPEIYKESAVQLTGMLIIQLFYLAVPFVYFRFSKRAKPMPIVSVRQKITSWSAVIALALAAVCMLCFYLPAAWFDQLLQRMHYNGNGGVALNGTASIVFGVVLMVLIAPFVEELIFRGFLLSGLRTRFKEIPAVLLSGLAFSLMHMNPEQTVYQFCLGCVCGYTALKTHSLILPFIIHGASNLIALLFDLTPLGGAFVTFMNALTSNAALSVLSTVALFVAGVAIVFFVGKLLRKISPPPRTTLGMPTQCTATQAQEAKNAPIKLFSGAASGKIAAILFGVAEGICLMLWIFVFVTSL